MFLKQIQLLSFYTVSFLQAWTVFLCNGQHWSTVTRIFAKITQDETMNIQMVVLGYQFLLPLCRAWEVTDVAWRDTVVGSINQVTLMMHRKVHSKYNIAVSSKCGSSLSILIIQLIGQVAAHTIQTDLWSHKDFCRFGTLLASRELLIHKFYSNQNKHPQDSLICSQQTRYLTNLWQVLAGLFQ